MSLNKPLVLKLQCGDDIRKVPALPSSYDALAQTVTALFGPGPFRVKYLDEEQEYITIASDIDLQSAYETAAGPSLRLLVLPGETAPPSRCPTDHLEVQTPIEGTQEKPQAPPAEVNDPALYWRSAFKKVKKVFHGFCGRKHGRYMEFLNQLVRQEVSAVLGVEAPTLHPHVRCDECSQLPLAGVRYKCTVCDNFDLCELCEAKQLHPHPLLKINNPSVPMPHVRCSMEAVDRSTAKHAFKNFQKIVKVPKPRMDFLRHRMLPEESEVSVGQEVQKSWIVRNPGPLAWPQGVTVQSTKGDFVSGSYPVDALKVGEEGEIVCSFPVPQKEGKVKGVFRLSLPDGRKFGEKLRACLRVVKPKAYQTQLDMLRSMGFEEEDEELHALLERNGGDFERVLSILFERL